MDLVLGSVDLVPQVVCHHHYLLLHLAFQLVHQVVRLSTSTLHHLDSEGNLPMEPLPASDRRDSLLDKVEVAA